MNIRNPEQLESHLVALPKDHFLCANCREPVALDDMVLVSSKKFKGLMCLSHAACAEQTINFMKPLIKMVAPKET